MRDKSRWELRRPIQIVNPGSIGHPKINEMEIKILLGTRQQAMSCLGNLFALLVS